MNLHDIYLAAQLAKSDNSGGNVDLSNYYTKSQTDSKITAKVAEIVADAPEDFDTLKEMSDWIASHEDSASAMNTAILTNTAAIAQKADKSTTYTKMETDNLFNNKVNKVSGKGLSTNDFTNDAKSKLDGLENYDDTEIKAKIAETAEQTALNRSALGYHRKNLLINNCSNRTINGVTATVNDDGSITLNGTSTLSNVWTLFFNMETGSTSSAYMDNKKRIPNGKYILSTGLTTDAGVYLHVAFSTDNESESRYVTSGSGGKAEFNVTDEDEYVWARLRIGANASFDNVTVYPMIRSAEIADDTYEPYKPSIEERLAALENAILGGNSND